MWLDGFIFYSCAEVGSCVGIELLVQSTPDVILWSSSKSQEKKNASFIQPSRHFSLSFSFLLSYFLTPFDPPPFRHSPFKHPRCPQAAHWGPLHYAWRVCHTCGTRWTREGKEVAHRFQQGGGPERGDPGGSRQEDAGETWQRQRHHLCPHCHEHGEDSISFPGSSTAEQRCCMAELNWCTNMNYYGDNVYIYVTLNLHLLRGIHWSTGWTRG